MDYDATTKQLQGRSGFGYDNLHTTTKPETWRQQQKESEKERREEAGSEKMTQGIYVVLRKNIGRQSVRGL